MSIKSRIEQEFLEYTKTEEFTNKLNHYRSHKGHDPVWYYINEGYKTRERIVIGGLSIGAFSAATLGSVILSLEAGFSGLTISLCFLAFFIFLALSYKSYLSFNKANITAKKSYEENLIMKRSLELCKKDFYAQQSYDSLIDILKIETTTSEYLYFELNYDMTNNGVLKFTEDLPEIRKKISIAEDRKHAVDINSLKQLEGIIKYY